MLPQVALEYGQRSCARAMRLFTSSADRYGIRSNDPLSVKPPCQSDRSTREVMRASIIASAGPPGAVQQAA
jgi:hypothetical protein